MYRVIEIFKSLQGEGYNTGKEVIFIRFVGCNLACPWCDTPQDNYTEMSLVGIVCAVRELECKSVIITGGEPFVQDGLNDLLLGLKALGYWIGIETNGTVNPPERWRFWKYNYIATSPKTGSSIRIQEADEVRVVVSPEVTTEDCRRVRGAVQADHYYLSPCESGGEFNIYETIQLLGKLNEEEVENKWMMSIQTHKLARIR